MKKFAFIISLCLILFTGCNETDENSQSIKSDTNTKEDVNTQIIINNRDIILYKNDDEKAIQLKSSYFNKISNPKPLVKVYDKNGNLQKIEIFKRSQSIYISGDFENDNEYSINLKANDIITDDNLNLNFDYNESFVFLTKQITLKDIKANTYLKTLKSANMVLTFDSGKIISKDIRKYIEFYDKNINYTFKINNDKLMVYGNFKPNSKYEFKLKKGFESGSSVLMMDLNLSVTFNNVDKNLSFTDYKSYVSSSTEAVDIQTTNISSLDIEILKINTENLNYLNLFDNHYLKDKYYHKSTFFDSYSEVVEKFKKAIPSKENISVTSQLSINDKLKYKKDGIYLVLIKDSENKYLSDSKLVFKSDLGISTKVAKDQIFFSIRSLSSNEVLSNAEISIYSSSNKLLFKGKTNKNGIFSKDFKNIIQSKPKLVIVKKDEQINFLNLENSISSYDILNDKSKIKNEYDALVFMERSLLRPSDNANMLITVKNKSFESLKNQLVYLQFIDPSQDELFTKELRLNEAGIAEYNFKSFNDYKTGEYRLNVLLGKEKIGYKEFNIEAFIPEKIDVKIQSKKDNYLLSDNIEFNIKSKYLFGTPAKGLKYDLEIIANKSNFISKNHPSYSFKNHLQEDEHLIAENVKRNGILDDNGNEKFNISLNLNRTSVSLVKTSLIGTVYDDGRAVRKFKELNIYPFKAVIGIKKNFEGTPETNVPVTFTTALINPLDDSKITKPERLKVKVFKHFYHYYAGEEIREIESYEINSNKEIEVTPQESGTYYVSVQTPDGQISSETFYASGWDYDSFNIKDKSSYKIDLKTDKESYKSDEIISLDIKSPISGKLLLTLEEDKVIAYKIIEINKNTASIKIALTDKIKKGAYIKAQLIRSTETSDSLFPFRVIGSKYIKKDNASKRILIAMQNDKLYKSGDEVTVKVKSNVQEGYAVISMVDSGILNIIDEKPTNAFKYFDRKNEDNVSLYDLYSNLQKINKLKAESVSGDGVKEKRKKHLSPDAINERVKPVSFWSKIIKLDEGIAKAVFKLPNFNGEVLIQSVIVSDDKIGSSHSKAIIKDDVVIKPTLPRFLTKYDKVDLPVRLLNTTDKLQNINLSILTTSNLESDNESISTTLNPKESIVVEVGVKALEKGLSKIIIKATNEKEIFTNEVSIFVKDYFDYELVSKFGLIKPNESIDINIIDSETKALNTKVDAYIGLDNSPFSKLSKSSKYLISYPHGCAEQTSSKLLSMLMSKNFIDKEDVNLLNDRKTFINQGIDKLLSMQNNEGAFTYWKGGTYVNDYASSYSAFVLNMLNQEGFDVPKKALEKALNNSSKNLVTQYENLEFFYAYADRTTTNILFDKNYYGHNLTSYVSLAAAMKKHNNIQEYKQLIAKAKTVFKNYNMNTSRSYSNSFYSPIKDIASSLYIYTRFISADTNDEFSKNLFRTVSNYVNNDDLYSTQDKAFAMMALDSYYKDIDILNANIDATIKYENELKNITSKTYEEISLKNKENLLITNNGGTVNYTIDINKPVALSVNTEELRSSSNLYFETEIIDSKGISINPESVTLGDKLFAKVKVKSLETIENVAINIQIPSGLEIINPRLYKTDNQKFANIDYNPDYEDYRDDRVLTYLTTNNGQTTFFIPLIATTKGTFIYPASYIEAMYDSRLSEYHKPFKTITIK